jgi:hypothetical protein
MGHSKILYMSSRNCEISSMLKKHAHTLNNKKGRKESGKK